MEEESQKCSFAGFVHVYSVWLNEVKFMHHNFKGKFYAPVFSGFIGFTYKVNVFIKTSTQDSLL